jgi:hypothetical protein
MKLTMRALMVACLLFLCGGISRAQSVTGHGISFDFANIEAPIAGVAADEGVVFVGEPLNASVIVLSRSAISLVAPTPADIEVEELLDFSFNPYDEADPFLYAAQPLQLQVIRIDLRNGAREVLASGAQLFDFPSSLSFVPPPTFGTELLVVSNQQERTPLTNDAVSQTTFNFPFIVAKVAVIP